MSPQENIEGRSQGGQEGLQTEILVTAVQKEATLFAATVARPHFICSAGKYRALLL